jgi:hypothetical protein
MSKWIEVSGTLIDIEQVSYLRKTEKPYDCFMGACNYSPSLEIHLKNSSCVEIDYETTRKRDSEFYFLEANLNKVISEEK